MADQFTSTETMGGLTGQVEVEEAVEDEVGIRFSYHPATTSTGPQHDAVREHHRELAYWIDDFLPDSREKSLALTALQEAMMWSNAAIAYRTGE